MFEARVDKISQLANIFDPPRILYVESERSVDDFIEVCRGKLIGLVGSRKMTNRGKKITQKLVSGLVSYGFIIVSGMAKGIDGTAHQAAIDAGGVTIAVMGTGLDLIYPPEHRQLYQDVISSGGFVVSEIPTGKTVNKKMFPARNRIISGLSQGVIIVEAGIKSGSLITARLALDQGREVFAVAGSEGTDYLIDQGATSIDTTCRISGAFRR